MRLCWTLTAVLALALTGLVYVFGIRGSVAPASGGRTAILLEPGERDLVLAEMRAFLRSTQASDLLTNCVGCHAAFRIDAVKELGSANERKRMQRDSSIGVGVEAGARSSILALVVGHCLARVPLIGIGSSSPHLR